MLLTNILCIVQSLLHIRHDYIQHIIKISCQQSKGFQKSSFQNRLINGFAVWTILNSILGGIHTLPHRLFVNGTAMPCPSCKLMPTIAALTHAAESILTSITLPVSTGLHNFILRTLHADALCLIPHLSGNNRLMMFSDIKLVLLTHIGKSAFADRVSSKGFPKKNITLVLFILNNSHHSVSVPAYLALLIFPAKLRQPMSYGSCSIPLKVQIINHSHCLCLILIDRQALVLRVIIITKTTIKTNQLTTLHFHLKSHGNILR